ncbi:hypothetical protein BZG36_00599 [Bifiguratus adelaidae]|uniref:Aldehyde dehydrogenase domain-containing protein n=1 Tax=Bifiguratus adelaidae TaxID=1938954 RepID=A0A261Y781_9FUNG|nr:hypothetical protein BZG36_00599 [Bifiguratus adelaidae]
MDNPKMPQIRRSLDHYLVLENMTADTHLTVLSPATQQPILGLPYLSRDELEARVQAGVNAFMAWRKVPLADRVAILNKFCDIFESKASEIAEAISKQMGRPIKFAKGEVSGTLQRARYMTSVANECLADMEFEDSKNFKRFIRKEPLGLCYIIAAWNYPFLTMVNTVIPAILAGNTVILKHSPLTPLCGKIFTDTFSKAGLPEAVFQDVIIPDMLSSYLTTHPLIQFVNFTGSNAVGLAIQKNIAEARKLIPTNFELGGKDAAYVHSDAELPYTVSQLVDGSFFNSGQSCCAIERIYVHESVYDDFVQRFVDEAKTYTLGNPDDSTAVVGPMASLRFADHVREHISDAGKFRCFCYRDIELTQCFALSVSKGAKPLIDTGRDFPADKAGTNFVAPQVFVNVNHKMKMMTEETFGPIIGIQKVSSPQEALTFINDSIYGLTASVWTQDPDLALEMGDAIQTGTVYMNRCDYLDPELCWNGWRGSGRGGSLSKLGYEYVTRPKSYHLKLATQ